MKKKLLILTALTLATASGCGYLQAWRCNRGWGAVDDPYTMYGDAYDGGVVYDGAHDAYLPPDGVVVGPEIVAPGETIPTPAGEPLPGPAQ